ncbi:MAG: M20 family metallopeptidase [Candidatus Aminicenantales bacterium]
MGNKIKFRALIFLSIILISTRFGLSLDPKTSKLIDEKIRQISAEMIKIRRYLHMNPEPGNREFETAKLVSSKLNSLGLEVKTGVAKTGVVGLLRGEREGITAALRADMDALPIQELNEVPYKSLNPGFMHACGHDIHTTIALGTAHVLSSLKELVKGNVKFIFQPAEEGPPPGEEGGAQLMIKEGVLNDPPVGAIFALHVWPGYKVGEIGVSAGTVMASSDRFVIVIHGKSAHGARPHEGVDAVFIASQCILAFQSIISRTIDATDPAVLTVGKIEGGKRANIIAERVTMEGTLRTLSKKNRKQIPQLMENVVRGITQSFGANYSFSFLEGTPAVENYPDLVSLLLPTLEEALGRNKVKKMNPQMVAEDFSFYSQHIPGFYFFLGVKNPASDRTYPLHSPYFNPDEDSIPLGIKLMCHILIEFLNHQTSQ